MPQKIDVPEPEEGLKFIDAHCHLPFPRPKNDKLPTDEKQLLTYFEMGGVYLITSSIDNETLQMTLTFKQRHGKNFGFTCGWAPQTVTYTPGNKYDAEWNKWINYVKSNQSDYLAIGEIGLDFHHAKTLKRRNQQVKELKKIFEITADFGKPYVLHVRNAAKHEMDKENPKHRFNNQDGATKEILSIMNDFKIDPNRVMFHCFSGPENYGQILSNKGFTLSVPSSAFGYNRWRSVTKNAPVDSLVTETDSYYQHPYKRGPVNVPTNVRYSIAAIAHTHELSQKEVSEKTVENAKTFFSLDIEE